MKHSDFSLFSLGFVRSGYFFYATSLAPSNCELYRFA